MQSSQPDHHPAIQDFLRWQKRPDVVRKGYRASQTAEEVEYIPSSSIKRYFKEDNHLDDILTALFRADERPDAENIQNNYAVVFAILLSIHEGPMIESFLAKREYEDIILPFADKTELPVSTASQVDLKTRFQEQQHKYCHYPIRERFNQTLHEKSILPFRIEGLVGKGGSGLVHKITIDDDYNKLYPAVVGSSKPPRTCVLKTYRGDEAKEYHEKETKGFRILNNSNRRPENVIGYHGSFIQNDAYHIILQYADGTLEDFMKENEPPMTGEDCETFWTAMLELSKGLLRIHNSPTRDGSVLAGWHQDIKPTNVLYIKKENATSVYDCYFVLADLGLSHFKWHQTRSEAEKDADTHGTRAYGAPETFRGATLQTIALDVSPAVDLWSLGCVYSECATWVVAGHAKVREYRRRRGDELKGKYKESMGQLFHDGQKPLDVIGVNHDALQRNCRREDYMTAKVLTQLVNNMILDLPGARYTAIQVIFRSDLILREGREESGLTASPPNKFDPKSNQNGFLPQPHPPNSDDDSDSEPEPQRNSFSRPRQSIEAARLRSAHSQEHPRTPSRHSERDTPPIHHSSGSRSQKGVGRGSTVLGSLKKLYENGNRKTEGDDVFTENPPERIMKENRRSTFHPGKEPPRDNDGKGNTEDFGAPPRRATVQSLTSTDAGSRRHSTILLPDLTSFQGRSGNRELVEDTTYQERDQTDLAQRTKSSDALNHTSTHKASTSSASVPPQAALVDSSRSSGMKSDESVRQENGVATIGVEPTQEVSIDRKPVMSLSDALDYKRKHSQYRLPELTTEEEYRELLDNRDHVFFIDNSRTMEVHTQQIRNVLEVLTYATAPSDPNGLDLWTTSSKHKRRADPKTITNYVDNDLKFATFADMRNRLTKILEEYVKGLSETHRVRNFLGGKQPKKGRWPLSLYILTDGIWGGQCDLKPVIVTLIENLKKRGLTDQQVRMQFIRFGNDQEGERRLKELDTGFKSEYQWDLIDTTESYGNVYKMLFGALNEDFDGDPPE